MAENEKQEDKPIKILGILQNEVEAERAKELKIHFVENKKK